MIEEIESLCAKQSRPDGSGRREGAGGVVSEFNAKSV